MRQVVRVLDGAGIQYMVSGSIAASLQGEPRSTHDIDIVVAIDKTDVARLMAAFQPPDFYLYEDAIIDAIDQESVFNLIDMKTGDKVDFWILTDDPFDKSRFGRKYEEQVLGTRVSVSSPEDTILVKLRWAKLSGGSEKQFTDALRVYEVQFDKLDLDYLGHWAKELSVESMFKALQDAAEAV